MKNNFGADFPFRKPRKGFHPVHSLEGRNNCMPYVRNERDGTAVVGVYLRVTNPRLREEIICAHFLQAYGKWRAQSLLAVTILGRDNPWDFQIGIKDGTQGNIVDAFYLEIVSIANDEWSHQNNTREDLFVKARDSKAIPLSLLKKINIGFPDESVTKQIEKFERAGHGKNDEVANPHYGQDAVIFVSTSRPIVRTLYDLILDAFNSKVTKDHDGKEHTILIIDNRATAYDIDDYHDAVKRLHSANPSCPFREVWFYNGYYSDNDGYNAEYSFAPLNVADEILDPITDRMKASGSSINEDGIIFY